MLIDSQTEERKLTETKDEEERKREVWEGAEATGKEAAQKLSRFWGLGTRVGPDYMPKKNLYEKKNGGGRVRGPDGGPGKERKRNVVEEGSPSFNSCYYWNTRPPRAEGTTGLFHCPRSITRAHMRPFRHLTREKVQGCSPGCNRLPTIKPVHGTCRNPARRGATVESSDGSAIKSSLAKLGKWEEFWSWEIRKEYSFSDWVLSRIASAAMFFFSFVSSNKYE